jgi:hypothetical protein
MVLTKALRIERYESVDLCWHGSAEMGRILVANRRGHQVVEWENTDTDEARRQIEEAERIICEAREKGCAVSRKVGDRHVLDTAPFDPTVEEYQVIAPIAGG